MSTCGCQAGGCGCNVIGSGDDIGVQRVGDTFVVSYTGPAVQPKNLYIQQADPGIEPIPYLWIELDGDDEVQTFWIWTP